MILRYISQKVILILLFALAASPIAAQQKGQFFVYWGYNRAVYTNSDISFSGANYDFTLSDVKAVDKPEHFSFKQYFRVTSIWIPQYVYRIGYGISNHWTVSLGVDHMKYVMLQNQVVNISGTISEDGNIFNGSYNNQPIYLDDSFLTFEHTDGLNYLNVRAERFWKLYTIPSEKVKLLAITGGSVGPVIPKSNVQLFNQNRSDRFHLAGFGLGVVGGLHIELWKHFFVRAALNGGYINMPSILTTAGKNTARAKQQFGFGMLDFAFGGSFAI